MRISQISIERPVLATVMSLTILLFGLLSLWRLPVREYPDIESRIVSVTTIYRGASAQVVETEITDVLEEQLSTIEGVKLITSSSQEQVSRITIEFELSRQVDQAANDVRDRVSRIRGSLPSTSDEPTVAKQDTNAQPIMWIAVSGESFNTLELSDMARNVLAERFQRLPGVGAVFVGGERRYAMRIWLDPLRLAAHGLTVTDVERVLRTENAEIPSGRIEGQGREFAVRTRGDLAEPEEFAAIVLSGSGGSAVRLGDVAEVRIGAEDERTITRYNGVPAVGIGVVKQQKASTVDVAKAVRNALPELNASMPEGMKLDIAFDSSKFIEEAVHEVLVSLGIAILLVFLVTFLFLRTLRATLVPAVAIPVSIIGTFTVTYFLGYSLNILTLLALVLAIGLVVDDAIIMLENIYRHMEMGKSRMQASIDGAAEVGFAILATTLALVAVFVPVAFLSGQVGRLFNEFGIAIAVSVMISGFVALTLSPMLCSRFLRPQDVPHQTADGKIGEAKRHGWNERLHDFYERMLRGALRNRRWVLGGSLAVLALTVVLFRALPKELVPTEDRGLIFNLVFAPEGSTKEYTDRYMLQAEQIYRQVPEVKSMFTAVGLGFGGPGRVTDGFMFVRLKPLDERGRSQQQIVGSLFPQLMSIPGVLAIPINPPSLGGGFGRPVQFVLQAETYDDLKTSMATLMAESAKLGYFLNADTDLKLNKPQIEVRVDRDRAAALGVSVSDIGGALQSLLGGREIGRFKRGNQQYEVILQVPSHGRATPRSIEELYVRGRAGLVQLASVVLVEEKVSPRELNHFNRVRSATFTANLAPGVTIGTAIDDLRAIAKQTLPPTVRTDLAGESREFAESSSGLNLLFLIALAFIFLVLAGQFESFVHPMTILVSVPLAVFGALASLWAMQMSINIYSQIGLIMLIGLVTKNAILIVEYANQRVARGESVNEAVVGAAIIRLRPILMTTLSTTFGVLPIAIGLGAGAESRKPLGVVVVGGMLFSTLLTLVLVPIVYSLLARFAVRAQQAREAALTGAEPVTPA